MRMIRAGPRLPDPAPIFATASGVRTNPPAARVPERWDGRAAERVVDPRTA